MTKSLKTIAGIWIFGIIVFLCLLIFLFLPLLNDGYWKRPSPRLKQLAQLHSISGALELFSSEFDSHPPSDRLDPNNTPYCGAMKLAEVMVGQDLMGFHPDSIFRRDGKDSSGNKILYDSTTGNSNIRKGPYLPIENANANLIQDIYTNYGNFLARSLVLCDVFGKVTNKKTKQKIGMPLLYYKADTSKSSHDVNNPDNPDNIYNYKDNFDLLALGVPGKPGVKHPLYEDPSLFYILTQNTRAKTNEPFNKESYILLSAGRDGLYGTKDDIANFDLKWRQKN